MHGHVKKLDLASIFTGFVVALLLLLWAAVTVSTLVLGLALLFLFPRAVDAAVDSGRRVGFSILWGILVGIFGPVLGVAIVSTILGIPLGIAVAGLMSLLFPLGYVVSAHHLGRMMIRRPGLASRTVAFLIGFVILRFAALLPVVGLLVGIVAAGYGIGAVTIAAWRAGRRSVAAPARPDLPP